MTPEPMAPRGAVFPKRVVSSPPRPEPAPDTGRPVRRFKRRARSWAALCLALALGTPGIAQGVGHYVPGLPNSRDDFLPPPGLYFVTYGYWYHTDTFKDRHGVTVDSLTVNVPGQGRRRFALDTRLNQGLLVPTLVWAPDRSFHGVRWAAYAAQASPTWRSAPR